MSDNAIHPGALAEAVSSYRDALARHADILREERALIAPPTAALLDVFEGRAAEDFRERWIRTGQRLDEDEERLARILHLLDIKLRDLRALDQPGASHDA